MEGRFLQVIVRLLPRFLNSSSSPIFFWRFWGLRLKYYMTCTPIPLRGSPSDICLSQLIGHSCDHQSLVPSNSILNACLVNYVGRSANPRREGNLNNRTKNIAISLPTQVVMSSVSMSGLSGALGSCRLRLTGPHFQYICRTGSDCNRQI